MTKETIKTLEYKDEIFKVSGAFSHPRRSYITIDVVDSEGNPYTICDSDDIYYDKIKTIKTVGASK